ncbi:MAG: DUF2946 domain-containing protein [Magnetovibrio sp.]|nr:DUF2946 domain-containing protein [Magnetovibrio sp.]
MARQKNTLRPTRSAHLARRIPAWLAVFTLLAQVLMPFGQALAFAPDQDVEYQIICTANGVKQIPINADGSPIDAQDARQCPFCFTYSAPSLLQPEVSTIIVDSHADNRVSFAQITSEHRISIWRGTPQPSRAPPLNV